jgi:PAS domain S-box-containing protein
MDSSRLWFKSRYGFEGFEQPREAAACQWVLEKGAPLLISDAGDDPRFTADGILLSEGAACRSYLGTPLISSSQQVIGTLAVLAREPGRFTPQQISLMEKLGRQAVTRLELYGRILLQEQAQRMRQRTERVLAIERCFVTATLDSIPALVAVLDTAGRVVRMNDPCLQMTGLSLTSVVGRPFVEEFLEAGDRGWAAAKLREAAGGQVSGPLETVWKTAAGEAQTKQGAKGKGKGAAGRRVSWTLRPLQGPNGEIQYVIVSGQDVTEQRATEGALLSSEGRYREMVESSLGFVFTCSMEGRLSCGCAGGADGDGADGRDGSGEVPGMPADAGDAGGVAGGIADSAQRRGVSPDRVAQPADAIAGRADVCVEPRHGRDGTARGRRGASPGDAAAGVDSGVSGRRDLWNRP